MNRTVLFVAATLAVAGCATGSTVVRPDAHTAAQLRSGQLAAEYEVRLAGERVGDAYAWSMGAYRDQVGSERRDVVHAALEVRNTSAAPLVVDTASLRLRDVRTDEGPVRELAPLTTRGSAVVAPGAVTRIEALFPLPSGISPSELNAFQLHWRLSGQGQRFSQATRFIEQPARHQAQCDGRGCQDQNRRNSNIWGGFAGSGQPYYW